jgi:prepilin-type N-terminal cleavage/methylation domain-containing protein
MKYSNKYNNGFTLIEVIAVLIILGIISAVAYSRSTNMEASLYSETEVIKTHLRYAQTQAMNKTDAATSTSPVLFWGVKCSGGNYWLFEGTSPDAVANIRILPDNAAGSGNKVVLSTKKVALSDFTVFFDGRGVPYSTTSSVLSAAQTITVTSTASSATRTITITPLTGYIP